MRMPTNSIPNRLMVANATSSVPIGSWGSMQKRRVFCVVFMQPE